MDNREITNKTKVTTNDKSEDFRTKTLSLLSVDLNSLLALSTIKPLNGATNTPNSKITSNKLPNLFTSLTAVLLSQFNKLLLKKVIRKELKEKNNPFVQNNKVFKQSLKVMEQLSCFRFFCLT